MSGPFITTTQVLPEHDGSDQPANRDPLAAAAVSVTLVFALKSWVQLPPQLIPDGLDVTVPVPLPLRTTVRRLTANVAVTVFAASIVTMHAPVPEHAPPQPVNAFFALGVGVSVTTVPNAKSALHVLPQLIPAGDDDTLPPLVTETVSVTGRGLNVAVTDFAASMVTTQLPEPVHAPDQLVNDEPAAAVGNSVTIVPAEKLAEQVEPQLIPVGTELTEPAPVPEVPTEST